MKSELWVVAGLVSAFWFTPPATHAAPPFSGTIFVDPDIITAADPTTFRHMVFVGRGDRWMFDRRANDFLFLNPFLFDADFGDGRIVEIQVNPEFGDTTTAAAQASAYAPVIGRLPVCLRTGLETVWIHRGHQPFGGGNNNLLIHIEQADDYVAGGILEETLVHEASHTSLDDAHARAPDWLAAQVADGEFISTYARDNPDREDIAESFLLYLAHRYRASRISASLAETIASTIPHRLAYFQRQNFDIYPLGLSITGFRFDSVSAAWQLSWMSSPGRTYVVATSTDLRQWEDLAPIVAENVLTTLTHTNTAFPGRAFFRVRELPAPSPSPAGRGSG